MPIIDIQRRLTQIGVIRLGRQVPTGKTNKRGEPGYRPEKLETFRVTSPSKALIEAVARAYGGSVQPWQGPSGPEFEVITGVREFAVLIPPQRIDPNYESWGPGFRSRLCDGATERMRNAPCLCRQGGGGHVHDFARGECACGVKRECKPTTRVSVMLAEIPSIGTFKVESHGVNAAANLPSMAEAIENAPVPLPGRLTMELVDRKNLTGAGTAAEKVESRKFWVPKLIIDWLTPGQAYGGQIEAAARAELAGQERQAISASAASPGLAADTSTPAVDWLAEIAAAATIDEINALLERMKAGGVRDKVLVDAWRKRAREIEAAGAPVVEVVDAEAEPDRDEVWTAILRAAKERGWNLPAVERAYRERMNHDPVDDAATGWKLAEFLTALKSGGVK